ncbi:transporter substrate-binding domain-containing protein [Bdellovibrio sp. 22V]|uniref:substrate-binding periplasmic protein n=1 Tax=Bdellovibrio TaxID=958 RepID=UPI002542C9EB|nr:transporter substrate-binding domain-containing protein [Bdellovibrio sp. 22V]WII71664.1 transporter substrate-binding domain-containing protein [Bdellovibrio sp. 22V]
MICAKIALALLLVFFATDTFAKEEIHLSTGDWSPYISESLEHQGLIAQLAREAFANAGITMDLGFFPWVRATELSKAGTTDGTIAFVRLKEREKFYYYSDVLYTGQYVFFHLKSRPLKWNNISDLKNITIAATRGYGGMGEEFIQAEQKGIIKVLRLTSDKQSFNMLLSQRVDAVPSDLEVGYVYLRKLYGKDAEKFTHNSRAIQKAEYHLVISKKAKNGPALIEKFNAGLKKLHKSGRYKEIVREWHDKPIYRQALPASYLEQAERNQH